MKKKIIIATLALTLILCFAIGTTLAWLNDSTEEIKNTFTYGDINISLTESENLDLKMVPGKTITKDPKVTVKGDSEACWLFVEITESANFSNFMAYAVADGWTALADNPGVYYREVASSANDQSFFVLDKNQVTVSDTVTKSDFEAIGDSNPTLTFKAYAVQTEGVNTVAYAWEIVQK